MMRDPFNTPKTRNSGKLNEIEQMKLSLSASLFLQQYCLILIDDEISINTL